MTLGLAAVLGSVDALKVNEDAANSSGSDLSFLDNHSEVSAGTVTMTDGQMGSDLSSMLAEPTPVYATAGHAAEPIKVEAANVQPAKA